VIRLTWRQFRLQAAVTFAALAALAIVLAITGSHLAHVYDTSGIATCKAPSNCGALDSTFLSHYRLLQNLLGPFLLAVPALLGIFWGAPLVARELETGTYRLAWTQSVTRTRWFAVKAGLIGLATIAVAGLFSLMITWWASPIDRVNANRFTEGVFDARGIVAVGYAAFAFAIGLTAGVVIRRTLPAMATTLVAFVGARLAMTYWIRPHLLSPSHLSAAFGSATNLGFQIDRSSGVTFVAGPPHIPNAWVYSVQIVDKASRAPTSQFLHAYVLRACPKIATPPHAPRGPRGTARVGNPDAFQACIAKMSARFHETVTYQPAGRYWTFQWIETTIFLALALLLAGFSFWWVRRRLT
jgi:hypothetical protein